MSVKEEYVTVDYNIWMISFVCEKQGDTNGSSIRDIVEKKFCE